MGSFELLAAFVHGVPALVWAVIAESSWRMARTKQSESRFFVLLPIVAAGIGLTYAIFTFVCLIPPDLRAQRPLPVVAAFAMHDLVLFVVVACALHMTRYFPTPENPPSRLWLMSTYGSSIGMSVLALAFLGLVEVPGFPAGFGWYPAMRVLYQLLMLGLLLLEMLPIIRPGGLTAGVSGWVGLRRGDAFFLGGAMITLSGWLVLTATTSWRMDELWKPTPWGVFLDAIIGVGFAASMALRFLGHVVRSVTMIVVTGLAAAALCFGAAPAVIRAAGESYAPLVNLATLVGLIVIFFPGRVWLLRAIDGALFRKNLRQREDLQDFLQTLSPELGGSECARRALIELVRVMRLRGAALLFRAGGSIVHGDIDIAEAERQRLGGIDLRRVLLGNELRELPPESREALSAADVVGVVPVVSPRRLRGLLLLATDLLGATFSDEEERVLRGFADQLALVLDGADLFGDAVAAQRSLAHAEKLAAVGELAARVAHEIRNPVTAARSLAQQLCRDPMSPLNVEHAALIVEEMERVERRIAALLQYARREELQMEQVDLAELARHAGRAFAARFDAAGIAFECSADRPVAVRADRERMRQVLVNLMENALDALAGQRSGRLAVDVSALNGMAELSVTDDGPGVAPEAVGRLFDPFFSLKPKGTGLGLAIAKRIVDAHGGELLARRGEQRGLRFIIKLPSGGQQA